MTEAEWLACTDPEQMLIHLRPKAGKRKRRLFMIACCRRVWPLLSDQRSREAVEFAEGYVEGNSNLREMKAIRKVAEQAYRDTQKKFMQGATSQAVALAACCATGPVQESKDQFEVADAACAQWAIDALVADAGNEDARSVQMAAHCQLIRDIFGNPFRRVALDPAWLQWNGGTVRKMAEAIYDDRAFDRLPILADALEEAGCTDRAVLDHCRGSGAHVRGCWVIDLLLGKE